MSQEGRPKAYRPLPRRNRLSAASAAVDAWDRGDFFEAHELLEPAWMGTADAAERDLCQGLIKLAAAFVHEVRGNRAGVVKNLAGADRRLSRAAAAAGKPHVAAVIAAAELVDLRDLLRQIHALEAEIARQAAGEATVALSPPRLRRVSLPTDAA